MKLIKYIVTYKSETYQWMGWQYFKVEAFLFGRVVGHITAQEIFGGKVLINSYGVKTNYRKNGIGKSLLTRLEEIVKCEGGIKQKKIYCLEVFPHPSNEIDEEDDYIAISDSELVSVYGRLGFKNTGNEKNMEKIL